MVKSSPSVTKEARRVKLRRATKFLHLVEPAICRQPLQSTFATEAAFLVPAERTRLVDVVCVRRILSTVESRFQSAPVS